MSNVVNRAGSMDEGAVPPPVGLSPQQIEAPTPLVARQGRLDEIWRYRHFYLFVAPFFVLFAVFGLYPLLFSLFLSFTKWDGLTQIHWIGLGNFVRMADDEVLWRSLVNTVTVGLLYIPPMLILAFLLAQLMNAQWLKLKALWRAALFLPCVTPMVVIAVVFSLIFSTDRGVLNYLIAGIGRALPFAHLQPIPWLTSEQWSKISVAILVLWRWTGYNMILILAGLQGIPKDFYEAASIDGATSFQRMRFITWPLVQPAFRFCLLLSLLGTLYMFDEVFVLTKGGPGTSSTTFGLYLFNVSFTDFKFGYASCVAYSTAAVAFIASLLVTRWSSRRMRSASR